jgi:hypothetical protein
VSAERTVTVHTCDHGPVTVPEPVWCTGRHEDGLHLVDLAHEGPETSLAVRTDLGNARLLEAGLCQRPYGGNEDGRGTKMTVLLGTDGWHQFDENGLFELADALSRRAVELRMLARELGAIQQREAGL